MTPFIVGFSASLRNARSREGSLELVRDLEGLGDREALNEYLVEQGNLHLEQYYKAGREKGVPYDEMYEALKGMGGRKGLSNSEVCLVAALWGAAREGAEVDHLPLSDYFHADGGVARLEELRRAILGSDGIIISTPVYFGDRSSLSQRLIETIRRDKELRDHLRGKVYGGAAVGAKRNGGQETTLIYQMHDMMDLGMVGVGNDFETTSQYGGTGHAGDVGAMPGDDYGLGTCVGVGKRVARVTSFMLAAGEKRLRDKLKVGVWLLQDKDNELERRLQPFLEGLGPGVEVDVVRMSEHDILPCMACDICPSRIGPDEEFRCIRGKKDAMSKLHNRLLTHDVVVAAMYSPLDRSRLKSSYQYFLERTRYIRRGDYAFSDRLIVPLVLQEVGTNENLNLRMTTSLIRHHTVLQKPVMGWLHHGELLNSESVAKGLADMVENGRNLLVGRLAMLAKGSPIALYKPVGYVLSLTKDNLSRTMSKREKAVALRIERLTEEGRRRLEPATRKQEAL